MTFARLCLFLFPLLILLPPAHAADSKTAIFAGGCFWCMESEFQTQDGVTDVTSGYTGGTVENPTYEQVSSGETGHREAIRVTYDPAKVSYEKLLELFWSNVDPLDQNGQFCDKGTQYTAAIFTASDEEKTLAEASKEKMHQKFGQEIAVAILPAAPFYEAETHHQDYFQTHSLRYKLYREGCGRDDRLKDLWGTAPAQK